MAGIFPTLINNGYQVRAIDGTPSVVPGNVINAYVPPMEFQTSCPITYLPEECFSRIAPSQINAVVSELLCLAQTWDPLGLWDCGSNCNLSTLFTHWANAQTTVEITGAICDLPLSDGREGGAKLVYCTGETSALVAIQGDDSLLEMFLEGLCSVPSGSAATPADTLLSCGPTGLKIINAFDFQLYRGPWIQAHPYQTNHMVQKDLRLYSPNAEIPPGTQFSLGTSGPTWYEISPDSTQPYVQSNAYVSDTVVSRNGLFYAANSDIPAGTPFLVGTSGPTWRLVDLTASVAIDFSSSRSYVQEQIVVRNGLIYRARDHLPAGAWAPINWELIGGELQKYRGDWDITSSYSQDTLVLYNDRLYTPNAVIPANTPFEIGETGATWRQISATDLSGLEVDIEISFSAFVGLVAGETLLAYVPTKVTKIAPNMLGSAAKVYNLGGPTSFVLAVYVNAVQTGEISVVGGIPTFSQTGTVTLAPGDLLTVKTNTTAPVDVFSASIKATRIT